jgi:type IV fimbrial biogenesis protein FimT
LAVPEYRSQIARNRLANAAHAFKSDQQFARTEAIKRSNNIVVSRKAGQDGNWCYGLAVKTSEKTNCDCLISDHQATSFCDIKRILGSEYSNTNLETSISNNNTYTFTRGTTNAGGATFSVDQYAVRVVFSDVGRVRLCIPDNLPANTTGLPNTPDCS